MDSQSNYEGLTYVNSEPSIETLRNAYRETVIDLEEYKKVGEKDKGLIAKASRIDQEDFKQLQALYNRLSQKGVPIDEINQQVQQKADELKSKLKKDEQTSQLGTDDKDDGSKTKTDDKTTIEQTTKDGTKVTTNVDPNKVNEKQKKEVKQKE